jgi:hypothetical protein
MSKTRKSRPSLAALKNETAIIKAGLDDDVEQDQLDRENVHAARAPPEVTISIGQAYGDKYQAAAYLGVSSWRFVRLVQRRVIPRGFPMTPKGPHYWSFKTLDMAMAKCVASRKPRRQPPQRTRQRMEARG